MWRRVNKWRGAVEWIIYTHGFFCLLNEWRYLGAYYAEVQMSGLKEAVK